MMPHSGKGLGVFNFLFARAYCFAKNPPGLNRAEQLKKYVALGYMVTRLMQLVIPRFIRSFAITDEQSDVFVRLTRIDDNDTL